MLVEITVLVTYDVVYVGIIVYTVLTDEIVE